MDGATAVFYSVSYSHLSFPLYLALHEGNTEVFGGCCRAKWIWIKFYCGGSNTRFFFFFNPLSSNCNYHCVSLTLYFSPGTYIILKGATSGIGAETARVLAKRGLRLVIPARDLKKAKEMKERIQKDSPNSEIILFDLDLSSFASIKRFCSAFLSLGLPLNILINNAGTYCHHLEFSEDKFEMTLATNYLGHFLLTEILIEKMVETAAETGIEGRIINLSSIIHNWVIREGFQFKDMLKPKSFNGTRAYAQSKLANIMHAKEVAKQLKARNARVTINAVHPGIIKTGIIRAHKGLITDSVFFLATKLLKSTAQGASTTCYVALSPQINGTSGKYFADCNESSCSGLANDDTEARKLWKQTQALIYRWLRQPST